MDSAPEKLKIRKMKLLKLLGKKNHTNIVLPFSYTCRSEKS